MKLLIQNRHQWLHLAKAYGFSTIAITASTSTGDFICQYLESKSKETSLNTSSSALLPWWNSERSLIMCKTAIFVSTPYGFMQARLLERLFPGIQTKQIVKKMLTGLLAASIGISIVFAYIAFLKDQSIDEAKAKIKSDTPKTFVAGMFYWPFISFLNFRFIPLDYRPFIASLAGAIWNIYISSVVNQTKSTTNQLSETMTILVTETGAIGLPPVQDTFNILDQNSHFK